MDNWNDMDAGNTFSSSTTGAGADFDHWYLSYPLSHVSKTNHETGNKIIMPASALHHLASLSVSYPLLFRIENTTAGIHSHCGVVEFTADEGFVFMPTWMMNNMHLQQGELVNIKNVTLPKGNYIKIKPHATKFTTLSDHKSLLEKAFREFVSLTTGDTIVISHDDEKYLIDVVETRPSPAVLMFETDCEVEFAQPLDYKEPEKKKKRKKTTVECEKQKPDQKKQEILGFKPFTGVGRRVDGQPLVAVIEEGMMLQHDHEKINKEGFKAFTGKSYRLS
ncbi:hypothetical protein SSX86_018323 [Deinandra increscens subsp. villosa]|uniref:Ubiquitin fusion degradaton protein n=1 Tax=Deinandra increscens subsp. villosa TaxID=3103831 RepID=A0AAP0CV36_9ASTR